MWTLTAPGKHNATLSASSWIMLTVEPSSDVDIQNKQPLTADKGWHFNLGVHYFGI
jgi:hypothetical protein